MKAKAYNLVLFLILFYSIAQSQLPLSRGFYSIDKQIEVPLKKFKVVESGCLKNSMKIRVASKNLTLHDSYTRSSPLDCYTKSYLSNDTIYVTGHMLGELGWGFQLALFKDTFFVAPFAFSDGNIYKYNQSDKDSINFILLKSVATNVVLSKKPLFKEGEIVEGLVELRSVPFYYTDFERNYVIELQAFFKTKPLRRD